MATKNEIIHEAGFSPNIKSYILIVVGFFLLVSVAGIPLLIVWYLGFGQYLSRRYYENLECRLTTQHLEFKKGVLFKVEKTIPLENIQDLTFISNPILQWLDLRILKIETAGNSKPQGMSDMKLVGISEMAAFKKMVLDQRSALKNEDRKTPNESDDQALKLLTEIRDLLVAINLK